jgi:dephospho-CoA kinase
MPLLVSLSGRIGSGKSSVAETLAATLGWKGTSFGGFLRAELTRRGKDAGSREALQDLGQMLVDADAEGFCKAVLDAGGFRPGDNFILDGVRHLSIQKLITNLAVPSAARLIFLDASGESRLRRMGDRPAAVRDFDRAEAHKVESEMSESLPAIANACIDANQKFETVIDQCLIVIRTWMR